MPSIRHHLTIAESLLTQARAHLESAFEHTIDQNYDSRWTSAIDVTISENAATADQVTHIKTLIEPPVMPKQPDPHPSMKASSPP